MILIDSNVILDILIPDPIWRGWSMSQLQSLSSLHDLAINPIIHAEISVSFATAATVDQKLKDLGPSVHTIPRAAAFLAGKAYTQYRGQDGTKANVLADFFIGAHAAVLGCPILTRDTRRYAAYFPSVHLVTP